MKFLLCLIFSFSAYAGSKNKALIVLTSHDQLGKTNQKTGYYLSEVTHPYFKLVEDGIEIDFASPKGGRPPMDEYSRAEKDEDNKKFLTNPKLMKKLESTLRLSEVKAKDYSLILFAGGHGTMWDFPEDKSLIMLTRDIYENGGIVSAICHGPAALLNVTLSNGKYLVQNKRIASFTNGEEAFVKLEKIIPFSLEDKLAERGAIIAKAADWAENVVVDGRLITAQNPQSATKLGIELVKALKLERLREKAYGLLLQTPKTKFDRKKLKLNVLTQVLAGADGSYTTVYIGKRKNNVSKNQFLTGLSQHIQSILNDFPSFGLSNYSFFVTNDYEFAIQSWKDKDSADKAFASAAAKPIFEQGSSIMEHLLFEEKQQ